MRYSLNMYSQYINDDSTCIEVYSDNETAAKLLAMHSDNSHGVIKITECINSKLHSLPMPSELILDLEQKIADSKGRCVVVGIDGYLTLLSKHNRSIFMMALQFRLDEQKLNAAFMISKSFFDRKVFDNPKYENSLQIVNIVESENLSVPPTIAIVPYEWLQNRGFCKNWSELLQRLGNFVPGGFENVEVTLAQKDFNNRIAGLSENIYQFTEIKIIAKRFYGIDDDLPHHTLEKLILKSQEAHQEPLQYLENQFEKTNINPQLAVKRLIEMINDELWQAYVWLLKKRIDKGSYLSKVLAENIDYDSFLRIYIAEYPVLIFGDIESTRYAKERAGAIKELSGIRESYIIEFIGNANVYTNDVVACWLNCGTTAEKEEIVRRVSISDLTTGVSHLWNGLYPSLENYLSSEFDCGHEEINDYFDEYRIQKLQNTVTKSFLERVSTIKLPTTIQKRDVLLAEIAVEDNTALLIVDGMGIEYLPCILAMADQRKIKYERAEICDSNLPTETEFNEIKPNVTKLLRLKLKKGVDNIAHEGKVKGEKNTAEQNIVAVLESIEEIINQIATALIKYDRVVVTSDHGASRLAVIASEKCKEMVKTIPDIENPLDWRYTEAIKGKVCPTEFEVSRNYEQKRTYWVLRNYDRLSKQGAPRNEVHGGATLEERLVPLIIFSKTVTETIKKKRIKKGEQLMEEIDFDLGV